MTHPNKSAEHSIFFFQNSISSYENSVDLGKL